MLDTIAELIRTKQVSCEDTQPLLDSRVTRPDIVTSPSFVLLDISEVYNTLDSLVAAFPAGTRHCFAVKSNPLTCLLTRIAARRSHRRRSSSLDFPFGFECASFGEVTHSRQVLSHVFSQGTREACEADIVFDSPCKTWQEIRAVFSSPNVRVNADSIAELLRIGRILSSADSSSAGSSHAQVGLRINPEIGQGKIAMSSTATKGSKFGVPISSIASKDADDRWILQDGFLEEFPFVSGLHCHVGSAGMSVSQLVEGVRIIVDVAHQINARSGCHEEDPQIRVIDIGGGFPVRLSYDDESAVSFSMYWEALSRIPGIGQFQLITEFGNAIIGQSGFVVSKIEYVKQLDLGDGLTKLLAVVHVGADMFCRTAYSRHCCGPDADADGGVRRHQMKPIQAFFISKEGHLLTSAVPETETNGTLVDVVGPLCFSGDIVCQNCPAPLEGLKEGDWVVFPMCGAYTMTVWSKYCSRRFPEVWMWEPDVDADADGGGESGGHGHRLRLGKPKETMEECLRFWGSVEFEEEGGA